MQAGRRSHLQNNARTSPSANVGAPSTITPLTAPGQAAGGAAASTATATPTTMAAFAASTANATGAPGFTAAASTPEVQYVASDYRGSVAAVERSPPKPTRTSATTITHFFAPTSHSSSAATTQHASSMSSSSAAQTIHSESGSATIGGGAHHHSSGGAGTSGPAHPPPLSTPGTGAPSSDLRERELARRESELEAREREVSRREAAAARGEEEATSRAAAAAAAAREERALAEGVRRARDLKVADVLKEVLIGQARAERTATAARLGADTARVGRVGYVRTGMGVTEVWEDGTAWADLVRKGEELAGERDRLEKDKKAFAKRCKSR